MYLLTVLAGVICIYVFFIYSKKETFDVILLLLGSLSCFLGVFGLAGNLETDIISIAGSIIVFSCSIFYYIAQRKLYKHEENLRFRTKTEPKEPEEDKK